MKTSTTDQIKGTAKQVEGGVKKEAGKVMGRRDIEEKGRAEQAAGTVQKKVGQIKKVFGK